MKKIFTLAAILLSVTVFSASALAAEPPRPNYGKVSIKSRSDAFIQVVIDGKQYNMNNSGFVMDNLRPGRHTIQIYRANRHGMFRKRSQLLYSNTMNLRPWELVDININRNERVSVVNRVDPSDRFDNGRYDRNDHRGAYGNRNGRF